MRYVILGLLLGGPLSLYDLQKLFASGISLFYSASSGSIQRALHHLTAEGAVIVGNADDRRRGRKVYRVTATGRELWRAWMTEETAPGADAETTILAKIFFLGRLEPQARPEVIRRIRRAVEEQAAALQTLAGEIDRDARELDDEARQIFVFHRATLDYGLRAQGLLADWIDEVGEMAR